MKEAQSNPDFSNGVINQIRDGMKNTAHLSKVLQDSRLVRAYFDPESTEDRAAYLVYLKTGRWTKMFYCEQPSLSITATIERKLIQHTLKDVEALALKMIEDKQPGPLIKLVKTDKSVKEPVVTKETDCSVCSRSDCVDITHPMDLNLQAV